VCWALPERRGALTETNVRLVADAVKRAVDSVPPDLADRQQVINAIARELRSATNA
jgi:hypothetical protein